MQTEASLKVEISSSLNENFCVLFPKNSSVVYLFWKFSDFKIEKFEKREFAENLIIRIFDEKGDQIMEITAPWNSGSLYINLPRDNFKCFVKLYSCNSKGLEEIAMSNIVEVPSKKNYSSAYSSEFIGRRV